MSTLPTKYKEEEVQGEEGEEEDEEVRRRGRRRRRSKTKKNKKEKEKKVARGCFSEERVIDCVNVNTTYKI